MTHLSCDSCGKTLPADGPPAFRWTIDAGPSTPVSPPGSAGADLDPDSDSVEIMDELLQDRERSEVDHDTTEMMPVCVHRTYDLCEKCFARLAADPLGLTAGRNRPFSRN